MVMYIAHRAAFLSTFTSRRAVSFDREDVEDFLEGMIKTDEILKDFDEAVNYSNSKDCYMFFCEETIVGLAIVRCFDRLKRQFFMFFVYIHRLSMDYIAYFTHSFQHRDSNRLSAKSLSLGGLPVVGEHAVRCAWQDTSSDDNADFLGLSRILFCRNHAPRRNDCTVLSAL